MSATYRIPSRAAPSVTPARLALAAACLCLLATGCDRKHPDYDRDRCYDNLKRIGLAVHLYAIEHGESLPLHLGVLYKGYITDAACLVCPSSKEKPSPEQKASDLEKDPPEYAEFKAEHTSYFYVSGWGDDDPGHRILAYESQDNHGVDGLNVLLLGGKVQWMGCRAFRAALEEQMNEAKKAGRELVIYRGSGIVPKTGVVQDAPRRGERE